jgi:DNA-binding transcriptional LysR family regulator
MKQDAQSQSSLRAREHDNLAGRKDMLRGRLLPFDLLRAFVAVVECNGYTSAAHYLHRTQAAISQQIARLEDRTGIDLFEKPTRQLKLTEQGKVLLEAQEMQRKLGPAFDLTINAFQGGEGNGVFLRKEPVVWAVSRKASPHHKQPIPLALLPQGSLLRRWAEEALTAVGRRWVVMQESTSEEVLKASVLAGLAVGVFQEATMSAVADMRILTPEEGSPRLPSSETGEPRAAKSGQVPVRVPVGTVASMGVTE